MRPQLSEISLSGFKTIRELKEFSPGRLTVLIGPNGAGKSNFISFFQLLSWMLTPPGKLQELVARQGGASKFLVDGPAVTSEVKAHLKLRTGAGENEYSFRLSYAADDTFIFTEEQYRFSRSTFEGVARWQPAKVGQREAELLNEGNQGNETARVIGNLLRRMIVHQFHNTSPTARIREKWALSDNRHLKEDAGNLAPVLYRLKNDEPIHYKMITDTIRETLPFFEDFELEPEYNKVLLRWREKGSDLVFGAAQAADGMLRFMALTTLLLLPEDELPDVLILDEPELGLHPSAITTLGGLIRSISTRIQVIIATQSVSLVDCFEPDDIVVVERHLDAATSPGEERGTSFKRLQEQSLSEWLEDYSLSQLWEKNVFGGRP